MTTIGRDKWDMRWSRSALGIAAVVLAIALAGCGSTDHRSAKATKHPAPSTLAMSTTAPATTTTTAALPSAVDQLTPFINAARTLDGQLRAAAAAINRAGPPWRTIPASLANVVRAADVAPVKKALPAGMPTSLKQPAVLVLSDLVSRRDAMQDFEVLNPPGASVDDGTVDDSKGLLEILSYGADGAAHFGTDLAALEAAARATPAFPTTGDLHARAEPALLAQYVAEKSIGGLPCRDPAPPGTRVTSLPAIVWFPTPTTEWWGTTIDGTINGMPFSAVPFSAAGPTDLEWYVVIFPCL